MKPDPQMQTKVRTLLTYLQRSHPHIYRGLLKRFTPADQAITQQQKQLAGFFDVIGTIASKTVDAVSNFASSQGFDKIAAAAAPFLANKAEKEQVEIQIKRIGAGLPPKPDPMTSTLPGPMTPAMPVAEPLPWKWIAGGLLGVGGLWLLISALNRPRR